MSSATGAASRFDIGLTIFAGMAIGALSTAVLDRFVVLSSL